MAILNLYSCGGAGFNLGSHFMKAAGKQQPGFAEINPVFLDTSSSNLSPLLPRERVYLIDGLDGSGKVRKANYARISECTKEMLHQFKPADINVVLHSASGGSGSVIGPSLVSELLAKGENVVVFLVGSTSSRIETENTIKTLKSYESISQMRQSPVVTYYRENSKDMPRGHVDSQIQTAVLVLAAIFSGMNRELDGADLRNFINYQNVTSFQPKLTMLEFFSQTVDLNKGEALVTALTLIDDKTTSELDIPIGYQAVGFLPDVAKEAISIPLPIHAGVVTGHFVTVVDTLESKMKVFDEARAVVVEKSILNGHHEATHNGLIF